MAIWFPLNNPIRPCSVFDKICWYLSLKRQMRKTEHFLFRWMLWVLTQIYSKTRVYWNCLSQSIWKFLQRQPISTHYLPEMLRIVLKENFFHFNGKHYTYNTMEMQWVQRQQFWFLCRQTMAYFETTTLSKTVFRTTVWRSYIHNIFSLWDMSKSDIEVKFTAETFDTETAFLDTAVYKGTRFKEKSILDAKTHFKQMETFLHTHFTSCHPPSVKKEKPWESYEKTPQKQPLRKIIQI